MNFKKLTCTNSGQQKDLSVKFCPLSLVDSAQKFKSRIEIESTLGGRNDTQLMIKSQTYEFSETHTKHNTIKWARKSSTVDFCPLDLGAGQCAQNSKAELELELVVEMKFTYKTQHNTVG